jgi:hypothetical protein
MFDEKTDIEQDLMMRSILEGAEEEVPAGVWDGVSAGLDKVARTKVVALWFRRAGIGVAAAAAAVAAVLLVQPGDAGMDIVPASDQMIAVVEPEPAAPESAEEAIAPQTVYMAQATPAVSSVKPAMRSETVPSEIVSPEEIYSDVEDNSSNVAEETEKSTTKTISEKAPVKEEWHYYHDLSALEGQIIDPVNPVRIPNVSFVISGLTGTNAAQNENGKNIFKSPELPSGPTKTGVKQTSTNSTYDIPLSFGAGIRVGLSPKWSIGTGVNYSMLSRKFFGTYTKVNNLGVEENSTSSDIRNTQHYIGIPVNAYYDIVNSRNVNLYVYAGGTAEKCITDRYDIIGTSIVHKEKVKGVQLSANVGIGVGFKLSRHLNIYIDPSLRYYFDCGQPHNIRSAQPLMLGFEVGLRADI